LTANLKKLWKNEYVQTAIVIGLIVLIILVFWFGAQIVLNTSTPMLVVVSGSMCIPYGASCDGWSHPFARTLHVGDLIVVQGVNPDELNGNYPNSDIIVFHQPGNPEELIVHRIAAIDNVSGTLYFRTKGDGNPVDKWPNPIQPSEYDPWAVPPASGVSQDMVVGKVIMRIPLIGNIVLLMRNPTGIVVIVIIAALLIILEFVLPVLRKKTPAASTEPKATEAV
jgi:signal peptidase I